MAQLTVHACPLCRHECKSRDHVRSHLHEEHRKSELIDAYLSVVRA